MKTIRRRKTRTVEVGGVKIGSGHPIAIQSMVKVPLVDKAAAVNEIGRLREAGCEIVRVAVETLSDAQALKEMRGLAALPLVADIHFDHRLALAAIEAGAAKVRLNPGNIYRAGEVRNVIAAARSARIPIRIGANSGSLKIKRRDMASALVDSVMGYLRLFQKARFKDIVLSLKASSILETVRAYQKISRLCDYPLHLGVTATGLPFDGVVKSSAGIGILLFEGIGDTIRLSLLGDPVEEVRAAKLLLAGLQLRRFGPEIVCCPTCGRCKVDLLQKAESFERRIALLSEYEQKQLKATKIALMGCVVNGPGEAKEAALGIAFSKHKGAIFSNGRIVRTVGFKEGEDILFKMLKRRLVKAKRHRRETRR